MKSILILTLIFFCLFPSSPYAQIVETNKVYTYEFMTKDILQLSKRYPELITYKSLATTNYGRNIWAIKLGTGDTSILINGAHHAREWMTSTLLMKMLETYAASYQTNQKVAGISPKILEHVSIWFVPMVNPDGVTLQQLGLYAFPSYIHPLLIKMNKGSLQFNRWKANINGVDLNRQYPANWKHLIGVSIQPSYQFYKGTKPLQAKEVKALVDFTYKTNPEIAVAYHSSGNMIFWGVPQNTNFNHYYSSIAKKVSEMTGYPIRKPALFQQGGGYTDWFVEEFKKPGITMEIGSLVKESSLPLQAFPRIWERNKGIGLLMANKALEVKARTNK